MDLNFKQKVGILLLLILALFFLGSCDSDEKVIEVVDEGRTIGAYIRTNETYNADFTVGNVTDIFGINIEVQDEQDGGLLQDIEVFISFEPSDGIDSEEVLLKTLPLDSFVPGPFGNPSRDLFISYAEALEALNLQVQETFCKDQFIVRLEVNLLDGRSFTTGQSSSKIIAVDDFWSSPFSYTISVVEPIEETRFVGAYFLEHILDGPLGPTFAESQLVEVYKGHSTNTREIRVRHRLSNPQEFKRIFRFTIMCDEVYFNKNLLSSKVGFCAQGGPPILLGPDTVNSPVDINDDTVIELWFLEGYLGFDGNCGFATAPGRIRLTKQ